MTSSLLASVAILVLAMAVGSLINRIDEEADNEPDPFRLHRFHSGDPESD